MPLFETVSDVFSGIDSLKRRRYGVIETTAGKLVSIHLRPFPKLVSRRELLPVGDRFHARGALDQCQLFYNQPLRHSNFLSLKYVVSTHRTRYATFRAALTTLDMIARAKRVDAILCDAANTRISDRLLKRLGWEPHAPRKWHRNYIKRFYGVYPDDLPPA